MQQAVSATARARARARARAGAMVSPAPPSPKRPPPSPSRRLPGMPAVWPSSPVRYARPRSAPAPAQPPESALGSAPSEAPLHSHAIEVIQLASTPREAAEGREGAALRPAALFPRTPTDREAAEAAAAEEEAAAAAAVPSLSVRTFVQLHRQLAGAEQRGGRLQALAHPNPSNPNPSAGSP